MLIDVHCHLDYFNNVELEKIIEDAKNNGVYLLISNAQDLDSMQRNLEIGKRFAEVYFCLGLHPCRINKEKNFDKCERFIAESISDKKFIGIGEIGLDFKCATNESLRALQKEIFIKQLNIAADYMLPVQIHSRKARSEVLNILENFLENNPKMHGKILLHWFVGNREELKLALGLECFISINSNILFSKSYAKYAAKIPLENMLLETDTPVMYNNKRAVPSWIKKIAKKVSQIKDIPFSRLEDILQENAKRIFKIPA